MRIIVTRWPGSRSDGIVLSTRGTIVRVAIPGCDDSIEFSYRGGHWFSEEGEPVEIEFPGAENSDFVSALNDRPSEGYVAAQAFGWVN